MLASLGAVACNLDNPGVKAPPGVLAFPVGLALSVEEPGVPSRFLYVANANVDLRFNGGSVQSYDLDELARRIDENGCRGGDPGVPDEAPDAGVPDEAPDADVPDGSADGNLIPLDLGDGGLPPIDRGNGVDGGAKDAGSVATRAVLCDGHRRADGTVYNYDDDQNCCFGASDTLSQLRKSEVPIDSFASAIAVSRDGKNVYVPVRSKTRLLYFTADAESGVLTCGGTSATSSATGDQDGRCRNGPKLGDQYVRGSEDNRDPLGFAAQPTALITGNMADLETRTDMSAEPLAGDFIVTTHETGPLSLFNIAGNGEPKLLDVLPDGPLRSLSVSLDPLSKLLYVAAATSNVIERVGMRVRADQPALYKSSQIPLLGLSSTYDIRDVQVDNTPGRTAEYPVDVYALLRGTGSGQIQSVVFLRLESSDGRFGKGVGEVRLGAGPSKMLQARIGDRHLLFVSCYQRGSVYVVDADQRQVVSEIKEFSGPFDMKIDLERDLLYVADYAASVVRIADLRGLRTRTRESVLEQAPPPPPRIVATIGSVYFTGSIQ